MDREVFKETQAVLFLKSLTQNKTVPSQMTSLMYPSIFQRSCSFVRPIASTPCTRPFSIVWKSSTLLAIRTTRSAIFLTSIFFLKLLRMQDSLIVTSPLPSLRRLRITLYKTIAENQVSVHSRSTSTRLLRRSLLKWSTTRRTRKKSKLMLIISRSTSGMQSTDQASSTA